MLAIPGTVVKEPHENLPTTELSIPAHLSGRRLDEILAELCPERSKAALQKLVRRGGVKLNGKRVLRSNIRPPRCAKLLVELDARGAGLAAPLPLTAIHEDEHLAVIDKPAGLLTHGVRDAAEDSVASRAVARFGPLPMLLGEERPGIVHRLDRETSGLIVVARTPEAMEVMREQFRERVVRKIYHALVHGAPESEEAILDQELAPRADHPDRQEVRRRGEGKSARTRVRLLEGLGPCSLLECVPTTGRRHQIRVHLHAAGTPVVGDAMYGARRAPELPPGAPPVRRHLLHAARLEFPPPVTGRPLALVSPDPPDLAGLVHWLRGRNVDNSA